MRGCILFLICITYQIIHAQNPEFGLNWVTSYKGRVVNFKNTEPLIIVNQSNPNYFFYFSSSCISDSLGNLILMTDGGNIYNKDFSIVENGYQILHQKYFDFYKPSWTYSQSTIIIPFPNHIYYVISVSASDTMIDYWVKPNVIKAPFDVLEYHVVDMKENNGQGKVVQKKIPMIEGRLLSKTQMMACRHANGIDWWLLKVAHDTTKILTFLATANGITYKGDFSFGNVVTPGFIAQGSPVIFEIMGMLTFSPDGKHFATTCNSGHSELFMADFDRCTGVISKPKHQKVPLLPLNWPVTDHLIDSSITGLCYSPNGRFLYVIKYGNIWQWDLENPDSATAWYQVANMDTTYEFFTGYNTSYIANNNRLYIGHWHPLINVISVINKPDELGISCDFCPNCLRFGDSVKSVNSLPCMPNWNLGAMNCDTEIVQPPIVYEEQIIVPNAFSPNGDGRNDTWHILNVAEVQAAGISLQAVAVYNRWGNEVYKSSDINYAWDAKGWANDTYYYYIRYKTKAGISKVLKGNVSVLR